MFYSWKLQEFLLALPSRSHTCLGSCETQPFTFRSFMTNGKLITRWRRSDQDSLKSFLSLLPDSISITLAPNVKSYHILILLCCFVSACLPSPVLRILSLVLREAQSMVATFSKMEANSPWGPFVLLVPSDPEPRKVR